MAIPIVLICLVIIASFSFRGGAYNTGEVEGIVAGRSAFVNKGGANITYMIVDLDNGPRITISIPSITPIKKGEKVAIIEQKTSFFGGKRYLFKEYLE